jgi:hypothetical protein
MSHFAPTGFIFFHLMYSNAMAHQPSPAPEGSECSERRRQGTGAWVRCSARVRWASEPWGSDPDLRGLGVAGWVPGWGGWGSSLVICLMLSGIQKQTSWVSIWAPGCWHGISVLGALAQALGTLYSFTGTRLLLLLGDSLLNWPVRNPQKIANNATNTMYQHLLTCIYTKWCESVYL